MGAVAVCLVRGCVWCGGAVLLRVLMERRGGVRAVGEGEVVVVMVGVGVVSCVVEGGLSWAWRGGVSAVAVWLVWVGVSGWGGGAVWL